LVPSTGQILTDKPTRANAILMAALHDAVIYGNGPDPARPATMRALFISSTMSTSNTTFITVLPGQNGYFVTVPQGFAFGADAGATPRAESYFSLANTSAVEGLSELWVGIHP
jgi:hypothetical protein